MAWKNPEDGRAYSRAYRLANRDEINDRKRARRAADPEKYRAQERRRRVDPVRHRAVSIKYLHGLSPDERAALWEKQNGRCYLCRRDLDAQDSRRVHIDHDHDHCPGKRSCRICQRGIACEQCNILIALADDDPARLRLIAANLRAASAAVRTRMANAPQQLAFGS